MPSVFTIQGASDCKRVHNRKTGCSIEQCYTGKGATGYSFIKGSSRCGGSRKRRRRRRRR